MADIVAEAEIETTLDEGMHDETAQDEGQHDDTVQDEGQRDDTVGDNGADTAGNGHADEGTAAAKKEDVLPAKNLHVRNMSYTVRAFIVLFIFNIELSLQSDYGRHAPRCF